ncbi:uncharacterized protein LOC129747819 [Uranotaenia lowii]|uniref:uncharacterized protein LOC129747819 n=1 Tax=Uranotaenia lowii TaxID=190385 RepID=UPI0024799958|nr:uncharacterized protein LOC129747819 [Uranotaenia lowii]
MNACFFAKCYNLRGPFGKIKFFTLPPATDPRREEWLKMSGNEDALSLPATARRYVCEAHFEERFMRRQFTRTSLRHDAVPLDFRQTVDRGEDFYVTTTQTLSEMDYGQMMKDVADSLTDTSQYVSSSVSDVGESLENTATAGGNNYAQEKPSENLNDLHLHKVPKPIEPPKHSSKRKIEPDQEQVPKKVIVLKKLIFKAKSDAAIVDDSQVSCSTELRGQFSKYHNDMDSSKSLSQNHEKTHQNSDSQNEHLDEPSDKSDDFSIPVEETEILLNLSTEPEHSSESIQDPSETTAPALNYQEETNSDYPESQLIEEADAIKSSTLEQDRLENPPEKSPTRERETGLSYQPDPVESRTSQQIPPASSHQEPSRLSEEEYFAMSLVGPLQRLPPDKRAIAKMKILTYLVQLECGMNASL